MAKDGQNSATADLNMGGNKLKNGKTATLLGDFPIVSDIQNSVHTFITSTGSSNAYVITLTPPPAAYVSGQTFRFKANFANTGAATLNVNGLGAKDIKLLGSTALIANDIVTDQIVEVVYDGTQFQALSINPVTGWVLLETKAASGSPTVNFTTNIDNTFAKYAFVLTDILPATANTSLNIRTSANTGSSFDSGASDYVSHIMEPASTSNAYNGQGQTAAQFQICGSGGDLTTTVSRGGYNGMIFLSNPSDTGSNTNIHTQGGFVNNVDDVHISIAHGVRMSAGKVDALQFLMTSGNIASGTFTLYGI